MSALLAAGCGTGARIEPPQTPTTLIRHDGRALSLEALRAGRADAIATAETIAQLERQIGNGLSAADAWRETERAHRTQARRAARFWQQSEPAGADRSRAQFREFGFLAEDRPRLAIWPSTPEEYGLLLDAELRSGAESAAWLRQSPATLSRGSAFLAACWAFELGGAKVSVSESLIGPHWRSSVMAGAEALMEADAAAMLAPMPGCPISEQLQLLLATEDEEGDVEAHQFLRAVLHGLIHGMAVLEGVPAGTRRMTAVYSYLIDGGEARATLVLKKQGDGWKLESFDYEPAAAMLISRSGARFDLMPLIQR